MGTTAKGFYYPDLTDPPDGPAQIALLAAGVDAMPGIALKTYAEINALTGAALWEGRLVYQTNTGPNRPNQGIYEWNGLYWGLPWHMQWGLIAEAYGGTTGTVTSQTDVTGLTVTFIAAPHRRYVFKVQCRVSKSSTAGEVAVFVTTNGNTVVWQSRQSMTGGSPGGVTLFKFDFPDTTLVPGSITRKVRVESFTSSCIVDTDAVGSNYLQVYDDGPAGVPA